MITFFVEGLRHLAEVGTVIPSSRWFARAMARSVRAAPSPKRVLEVGPGTGAITGAILPALAEGDEFQLVECNPRFCRHVEARLLRRYRRSNPGVRVELSCDSILSVPLRGRFDYVISTVPFLALPPPLVRPVLDRLMSLTAEGGELTYMEYIAARRLKAPFVGRARRAELRRIDEFCASLDGRYARSREVVVLNILPSYAIRLRNCAEVPGPGERERPASVHANGAGRRRRRPAERSTTAG